MRASSPGDGAFPSCSASLLGLGWFVRARVPETPLFREIKRRGEIVKNPFFEAVFRNPRSFLVAVGLKISEVSWVYILTVFIVVYATTRLQLPRQQMLNAVFIAALIEVVTIPLFGYLSDIIGRRALYFAGTLFTVCFAFPLFWLIDTRDPQTIVLTIVIALSLGHGTMFGLQSTYFPELFGTKVRYSGASFGFQLSAAIGGTVADRRGDAGGAARRHRGRVAHADHAGGDHLRGGAVRQGDQGPAAPGLARGRTPCGPGPGRRYGDSDARRRLVDHLDLLRGGLARGQRADLRAAQPCRLALLHACSTAPAPSRV